MKPPKFTRSPTKPEDKLPIAEKVAYSAGDLPAYLPVGFPLSMANQVFTMTLGVAPTFITIVMSFFRILDAFTDPLVGWMSDRFRSRFGRRRPFMLVGIIATARLLPLFFLVGRDWNTFQLMSWFLVFGVIVFFCNTLYNIPYQSLLLEMTPDYNERTNITAYKSFVSKVMGLGMGWIWYLTQLPVFADPETGNPDTLRGAQGVSIAVAIIVLIFGILPVFFCKERYYTKAAKEKKISFRKSLKTSLSSRPFLIILSLILFLQLQQLTMGFTAYLNTYYLFDGSQKDASALQGWLHTTTTVISFACIPLFTWLSRKIGKERCLGLIVASKVFVAISYWIAYMYPEIGRAHV